MPIDGLTQNQFKKYIPNIDWTNDNQRKRNYNLLKLKYYLFVDQGTDNAKKELFVLCVAIVSYENIK